MRKPIFNDEIDVINEKDIIINTKERIEVHQKGLLHREVHVWFLDKKKNIFFQKRGIYKSSGGLLDATVGGHVDKGEDYLITAIRETEEEIGIHINHYDLVLLTKFRAIWFDKKNKTINNFLRAIFIYIYPISKKDITKEKTNIGVNFKSFSLNKLNNLTKKELKKFDDYILEKEMPILKKYIENHTF